MTQVTVQFVRKSANAKIGAIPCTTTDKHSCPDSCALKNTGCYAESGFYTRVNWNKVTSGERGDTWETLCASVAKLPEGQLWRHNVAGDLPHEHQLIDGTKVAALVAANGGRKGFTYTHHNMDHKANRDAIVASNAGGFTINLSADNPTMADTLVGLGIAPVVSVVPPEQVTNFVTKGGHKVVICPAAIREGVTCATCKMCAIGDRKTIIGFPAHGATKAQIKFDQRGA